MKISPHFFKQHRAMFREVVSRPGEFWFAINQFVRVEQHETNRQNETKILQQKAKQ